MIIKPRIRGFVCVTAHPEGCAANVQEQIDYIKKQGPLTGGPKNVLIIGASTGYGLASRIASAFACRAGTVGVFYERPSINGRTATAGWYNSIAVEKKAKEAGLFAASVNGDAFSDEIKNQTIDVIKNGLGTVDLVIYSLASPLRTHPKTGKTFRAVLKPIGRSFTAKTLNTDKKRIVDVTIDAASEEEIAATKAVMGGEDWEMWISALSDAGVLAKGARSIAYSYIGPEVTWPVYKNGTIGMAKEDLEVSARNIDNRLKAGGGGAFISVNKAVVTQSSSAIPVVPLYISILFKVMKENGAHEGCIEQIYRLYRDQLFNGSKPQFDEAGRVRLDDLEMRPEVQKMAQDLWNEADTENLDKFSDFAGYWEDFLRLFGFGLEGVDYEAETDPELDFET